MAQACAFAHEVHPLQAALLHEPLVPDARTGLGGGGGGDRAGKIPSQPKKVTEIGTELVKPGSQYANRLSGVEPVHVVK